MIFDTGSTGIMAPGMDGYGLKDIRAKNLWILTGEGGVTNHKREVGNLQFVTKKGGYAYRL